ncbi:MAG: hypothetical protein ACYTE8_03055 [Planctomycetota bacterium]
MPMKDSGYRFATQEDVSLLTEMNQRHHGFKRTLGKRWVSKIIGYL